jgi:hypothetical protein
MYILKEMTIDANRQFHIDVLAVGVKPNSSNLDSDSDPSP